MKARIKNVRVQPTAAKTTQPLLNRNLGLSTLKKQLPQPVSKGFVANLSNRAPVQERIAQIELERAQAEGRVHVGILPPR